MTFDSWHGSLPDNHSAAYLSITCLNLVRHLSDEERASLTVECPVKFDELLESDTDKIHGGGFLLAWLLYTRR